MHVVLVLVCGAEWAQKRKKKTASFIRSTETLLLDKMVTQTLMRLWLHPKSLQHWLLQAI